MEITTKLPSAIHSFNFSTSFKHYQFDSVYFSKKIPRLFLTLISSSKENLSLCNQQRRPVYFLSPLSYFSLDHKFKKRVHLLLRRTSGASARVPGPEEFLLPYPSWACVSGGSFSREESTLGGGGSFSGLAVRIERGGAVLSRLLGSLESFVFPLSSSLVSVVVERQCGCLSWLGPEVVYCSGSIASYLLGYGGGYLGSLRVGESPVPARRN
ncbi:hypothetical protein YC2023_081320 [Brassica napus]